MPSVLARIPQLADDLNVAVSPRPAPSAGDLNTLDILVYVSISYCHSPDDLPGARPRRAPVLPEMHILQPDIA